MVCYYLRSQLSTMHANGGKAAIKPPLRDEQLVSAMPCTQLHYVFAFFDAGSPSPSSSFSSSTSSSSSSPSRKSSSDSPSSSSSSRTLFQSLAVISLGSSSSVNLCLFASKYSAAFTKPLAVPFLSSHLFRQLVLRQLVLVCLEIFSSLHETLGCSGWAKFCHHFIHIYKKNFILMNSAHVNW